MITAKLNTVVSFTLKKKLSMESHLNSNTEYYQTRLMGKIFKIKQTIAKIAHNKIIPDLNRRNLDI